ncbi:MAG TPA: Rid family detoxifying hydrolase [Bacteroidota bacterium]|nr:Rid family detoxifying hydrolase [Bacteroidota bacterium]
MKKPIWLFFLPVLLGCSKSEEELRTMIQEEISESSERSFITNAQVIGPYSPAVKVGSMLFVSGQIGMNPETTELAAADIDSQTRQALMNLLAILKEAGYDSSDVVQCSVFLKDIKDFPKMNLIYGGFFPDGKYPARSTVEVSNLPKNAKVEIAAIAYRSKH